MKKLIVLFCFAVLFSGVCFAQSAGSVMYVAVKSADLKNGTGFFAGTVGTLNLGDAVTVVGENGKWLQVRSSDNTGWAERDNFTTRRVVASGSATASEVALAGKGFSAEAETEYRKDGIDYAAVDAVERIQVSQAELEVFVNNGHLNKGN